MKWFERPQEAVDFWKENEVSIKGYEKHFDWENKRIKLIIMFFDKDEPAKVFQYDFDGVMPNN